MSQGFIKAITFRLTGFLYYSPFIPQTVSTPCPEIEAQPVNAVVVAGEDTTFSVVTSGEGLIYRWQVSSDGGVIWTFVSDGANYSGASTDTLTIVATPEGFDGNEYRAIISRGDCSDVFSDSSELEVNLPPPVEVIADILSVGGGGGGGSGVGDGGTGAGVTSSLGVTLDPSLSYAVTVGLPGIGGSPFAPEAGTNGAQSDFDGTVIAAGGFGGAGGGTVNGNGGSGSGGGGAGANGGPGTLNSISGVALCYGGGGGGGGDFGIPGGDGGDCGATDSGSGGKGTPYGSPSNAGVGGGGGGGAEVGPPGGGKDGGGGNVVIRYPGAAQFTGGTVTSDAGDTVHTFSATGSLDPL